MRGYYIQKYHKPKVSKKIKKSKHQKGVDNLESRLNSKGYYDKVESNVFYPLGEKDVHTKLPTREMYWEWKSNYSKKGYEKACGQTCRWGLYKYNQDPTKDYYGIFACPSMIKIVSKNGIPRN